MSCPVSSAFKVYIKTTNTCNLNCKHCYTGGKLPNMEVFDSESIYNFLYKLTKKVPIQKFEYSFHGGEPMLVPVKLMNDFMIKSKLLTESSIFGIQTNLVYTMTKERLDFLKSLDFVGTSWDHRIRFENKQEMIWNKNVDILINEGLDLHVTVSLTKDLVTETKPIEILNFMHNKGFKNILFERLTPTGSATKNSKIFPNSNELRKYFIDMWNQSIENKTYEYIHNFFLEPTVQSILNKKPVDGQRRCRGCEKQILTFNSDGTIGGCADGALENIFGYVYEEPMNVLRSKGRSSTIKTEETINYACLNCDVYDICAGDCYKQKHDEFGCMAPKEVMQLIKNYDVELLKRFVK